MMTQLCCAEKGNIYEVVNVRGTNRSRLAELGFNKGVVVTVDSHSENGPINIKLRNYHIALRREEAEDITVRLLESK